MVAALAGSLAIAGMVEISPDARVKTMKEFCRDVRIAQKVAGG
jgi:hypothetical protein